MRGDNDAQLLLEQASKHPVLTHAEEPQLGRLVQQGKQQDATPGQRSPGKRRPKSEHKRKTTYESSARNEQNA